MAAAGEPGEEDDYMAMTFTEPPQPKVESSIQRQARKRREAEIKAHQKSKAELAAQEKELREAGLSTSLDRSNKGFQMMEKLGFKGGGLGKPTQDGEGGSGRVDPIGLEMREGRGGIGLDSEKKRKFREEAESDVKRVKAEEGDYRERLRREREEKKLEGQIIGAMKVAERLDDEETEDPEKLPAGKDDQSGLSEKDGDAVHARKTLKGTNVLWRDLVRHRVEKDRDKKMRYSLHQSLSQLPNYDDPDEDKDYKTALGTDEEELDEEDPELDEFKSSDPEVRLAKLVEHLRQAHHYCFWCKTSYPDASMEGCPGETEEDHD